MAIESKAICQVALIVEDLDKTLSNYEKVFASIQPKVFNLPKANSIPAYTNGKSGDYSDCRMAVIELENIVLEITQPGTSDSPWKQWLDQHGPGVQHIGFMIPEENKDSALAALEGIGSKVYHAGFYPDLTYTFVDGFDALGVDLNVKWHTDNREKIKKMLANPEKGPDEF